MLIDLLTIAMVFSALIYGLTYFASGKAKADAFIKWEWKHIKKFFKWILTLISKGFSALARAIKA